LQKNKNKKYIYTHTQLLLMLPTPAIIHILNMAKRHTQMLIFASTQAGSQPQRVFTQKNTQTEGQSKHDGRAMGAAEEIRGVSPNPTAPQRP
jgi:hypothetical protein